MPILTNKEIKDMSEKERKDKLKSLRKELIKQNVEGEDSVRPKEIKKAIARILTLSGGDGGSNPGKDQDS